VYFAVRATFTVSSYNVTLADQDVIVLFRVEVRA